MNVDPLLPAGAAFLGQQTFEIRVLPIRRALAIDDSDADQLRAAIFAASATWGGARYPLLPVSKDGEVPARWVGLAQELGVIEVVDFTHGKAGAALSAAGWNATCRAAPPLEDGRYWNPHPVAAAAGMMPVREVSLPDESDLVGLAGVGGCGLSEDVAMLRENGWSVHEGAPDYVLAAAQAARRTVLDLTLIDDVDSIADGFGNSIGLLWIADDRQAFQDALWFWNLRASRPRNGSRLGIEVITTPDVTRNEYFKRGFLSALRETSGATPTFIIASHSASTEEMRSIANDLSAVEYTGSEYSEWIGKARSDEGPLTYSVNLDPETLWDKIKSSGRTGSKTVDLQRPDTRLTFASPKSWVPRYQLSGHVHLDIESASIQGPRSDQVAKIFHPNAMWAGDSLRLTTANLNDYDLQIHIPLPDEILRTSAQAKGLLYSISDKGQHILGVMSRTADLEMCRDHATIHIVRNLTKKTSNELAREIDALRREIETLRREGKVTSEALESIAAIARTDDRPYRSQLELKSLGGSVFELRELSRAMSRLLRAGLVEMGLVVSCPICGLSGFQPLATVAGAPSCWGCGSSADFRSEGNGSPKVTYRLNSLLHRLSQNGGLAPLAAYSLLSGEGAYVVPGVNLTTLSGSPRGEIDIFGWDRKTLFVGEAKMSSGAWASVDVEAEVAKAASAGADVFIAVCLENLADSEHARLHASCDKAGIGLRVLDQAALTLR